MTVDRGLLVLDAERADLDDVVADRPMRSASRGGRPVLGIGVIDGAGA